jgi:glycosyltransferase involved in cell wall biosynthesis
MRVLADNCFPLRKSMEQRKRILLLTSRIGGGGAQHVMALLARGLSRERFEVHLGLVRARDAGAVPPWVTVHPLGAKRARAATLPLLLLVWRLRPKVILSGAAETSFVALLLRPFFPPGTRVLVRQNGTVSAALAHGRVPRYTRLLYRLLYRRADRVICQSRAMAEDLARETGVPGEQIVVLPNPVDLEEILAARDAPSAWSGPGPHLLAVGRLSQEKGFDLLIEALASLRGRFPEADLILVGSGREEAALKALCRSLKMETAVRFTQQIDTPYVFFQGATLFVLPSRYEGMPNALLEAAAAGLPLVSTPASGGVVDLLNGRPGAWLATEVSVSALTEALELALESLHPGDRFHHGFFHSTARPNSHEA